MGWGCKQSFLLRSTVSQLALCEEVCFPEGLETLKGITKPKPGPCQCDSTHGHCYALSSLATMDSFQKTDFRPIHCVTFETKCIFGMTYGGIHMVMNNITKVENIHDTEM